MGTLNISTNGSFPRHSKTFSAMKHGHAHAVAEAIEYMSSVILPEAISLDHRLHSQGAEPNEGFVIAYG